MQCNPFNLWKAFLTLKGKCFLGFVVDVCGLQKVLGSPIVSQDYCSTL